MINTGYNFNILLNILRKNQPYNLIKS
ncbi:uncharacterized protein METZ01_LOCUS43822 [marine metagenome]|uniref:Uncharacterized protein n=1 Tax=marine metagenome TaxID=408172 RepID=A0A381RJ24_9ZZZZ